MLKGLVLVCGEKIQSNKSLGHVSIILSDCSGCSIIEIQEHIANVENQVGYEYI